MRQNRKTPPVVPPPSPDGRGNRGGRPRLTNDPAAILGRVEQKKRRFDRTRASDPSHLPDDYYARFTFASFRLEGIEITEQVVREALGHGRQRPVLRTRLGQRLRSHAAILRHIEIDLRRGVPLETDRVVRWYTAVSAGLSTTSLDRASSSRLEEIVRLINALPPRVQAALREVVSVHARLVAEPLVPGFNGILARLLLRFHLGRWGFPAVLFDTFLDGQRLKPDSLSRRLLHLVEQRYDALLSPD